MILRVFIPIHYGDERIDPFLVLAVFLLFDFCFLILESSGHWLSLAVLISMHFCIFVCKNVILVAQSKNIYALKFFVRSLVAD